MIPVRFELRHWRFALKPVLLKTETESNREYLTRAGAFIRKVEQRSMRKGTNSRRNGLPLRSKPNRPPKYWGDAKIRRSIAFHITSDSRSVIVSPKRWPGSRVVDILETGGRTTIYDPERRAEVPVTIANREYAEPARKAWEPKSRSAWEDSFRLKRRGRF